MTRRDRLLSKVLRYTKSGWPATVSEALKPYYRRQDEISTEDDCYYAMHKLLQGALVHFSNV